MLLLMPLRLFTLPLLAINPPAYFALKAAAQTRHELMSPLLGTHANDESIKDVYPV